MKAKLLFLVKLFIFSFALFVFWKAPPPLGLGRWYNLFLKSAVAYVRFIFSAQEKTMAVMDKGPYYLIPFISLVLSTPKATFIRKIKLITIGITAFFAFDFLTTVSGFTSSIQPLTALNALYRTTLLVLPIFLWLIPLYQELEDLWKPALETGRESRDHHCPICGKEKAGLLEHIKSVHGEKALKGWRVRRYLAHTGTTLSESTRHK
jgi:hypothetical protein